MNQKITRTILNVGKLGETSYRLSIKKFLKDFEYFEENLTGVKVIRKDDFCFIYDCYGSSLSWDALNSLKPRGKLIVIGAVGALTNNIEFSDIIVPKKIHTGYLSEELGKMYVTPDPQLTNSLIKELEAAKIKFHVIDIGTTFGIFDPPNGISHNDFKNMGYEVVECESATIFRWCELNDVQVSGIFTCSDTPKVPVELDNEQLSKIYNSKKLKLTQIALRVLGIKLD